eukprot:COSAG05_NODE_941_length_6510_cov_42.192482_4_plen_248_part_00
MLAEDAAAASMVSGNGYATSDFPPAHFPPGAVILSHKDPVAYYLDDFTTDAESEHLINTAKSQLARARVSDTAAAQGTKTPGGVSQTRTNSVAWLTGVGDPILEALEDRICDTVKWHAECTEEFQVIHYEKNQEYRPHYDAYDTSGEHGQANTVRGGNRLLTVLMYLSDVEAGGGTSFPNIGITVTPKKGRVLVFYNCCFGADGIIDPSRPDPKSLHSGDPVVSGVKWAVNKVRPCSHPCPGFYHTS